MEEGGWKGGRGWVGVPDKRCIYCMQEKDLLFKESVCADTVLAEYKPIKKREKFSILTYEVLY